MLNAEEQKLPRHMRRRITARRRTLIKKGEPFGRVKLLDIETGELPRDRRIIYKHFTRGVVDRQETFPLMMGMLG